MGFKHVAVPSNGVHRCFDYGWCGPEAIIEGLAAVERGEQRTVRFVITTHPNDGPARHIESVTIGCAQIDGRPTWRYCGGDKGDDPMGHGSHALVSSWDKDASLARACAALGVALGEKAARVAERVAVDFGLSEPTRISHGGWIFRQEAA